jgi:4-methylaminobutanoate oxidase (formaldehyde-forming)
VNQAPPTHARVAIVGGGIVGSSIAYHLTKLGVADVIVLERGTLTCGTSWHAAGLIMQLRSSHSLTELARYNVELYSGLEAETGQATGFKQNGTLAIARNKDRLHEIKRSATIAKSFGIEADIIGAKEAGELYPAIDENLVEGALFIAKDGQINAVDTVMSLIAGAKQGGARIFENSPVTRLERLASGEYRLEVPGGAIQCETLVLSCGLWTRELAARLGIRVPLYACEHMYVVTEPLALVQPTLPVLRDTDGYVYIKEEAGKLLIGSFEPRGKPLAVRNLPVEQRFIELPEDWDHFELPFGKAMEIIPALERAGIQKFMNGPESFTPDALFALGEAPGCRNCFVAAGFNSEGFEMGAGAGRALAEWIVEGAPTMDLSDVDIARYHPFQVNRAYLHDRAGESLGSIYQMHWPGKQHETARPARKSPLHDRLAARNACFGETAGWERAMWFAPQGVEPKDAYSHLWPNWYDFTAEECRAAREGVVVFDQSSFGKTLLQGRDACAFLQRACTGELDVPLGKLVYTHMLNRRGGIETDITVDRLAEDRYMIVSSAATHPRDLAWIERQLVGDERVAVADVTSAYAVLSVQGPKSRDLLGRVSDADLSNQAFPFLTSQEIDIGYAPVIAKRMTFIGELGWELHIPSEFAQGVYDTLVEAGAEFGLRQAGYHALEHLRCERAYREYALDITPDDTPYEAGLGFTVKMEKPDAFMGRDALEAQHGKVLDKRLVMFKLADPRPALFHDELIRLDGEIAGYISSGAYGFTLGHSVGMGYLHHPDGITRELLENGQFEIEIACERHPAEASFRPFYDPKGERVRV